MVRFVRSRNMSSRSRWLCVATCRSRADSGRHDWHRSITGALHCTHPARDLCGDTMGIIGFGNIGQRVAGLAKAFGMKVLAAERKGSASIRSGRIEFSRVLEQSDIVSLHCPLTDETRYLIGEDELRSMKRDAILINCANGELLDNTALSRALTGGIIGGRWIGRCGGGNPRESVAELASPQPYSHAACGIGEESGYPGVSSATGRQPRSVRGWKSAECEHRSEGRSA